MRNSYRAGGTLFLAAVCWLGAARLAQALGFRNPDQGARATGQGEAFVARADDATAVWYNPAGLVQLEGTHLTSGGYLLFPSSRYSGVNGSDEMNTVSLTPHLYGVSDFGLERWRFGIGLNAPFGNLADYADSGPFRYTAMDSMLSVMNFAPTIALAVTEQLSFGASANVYYGQTELNRMSPLAVLLGIPGLPDGRFHFYGDGIGAGATLGGLYRFNDQHSIGAVYRSPFVIDFEGRAVVRNDLTGLLGGAESSAEIQFPQSVTFGYAFRPNEHWRCEADIEWTNWEMLDDVKLNSDNPFFDASLNPTSTIPFRWQDSFFYELGVEYAINDTWAVRAGYIFSENSVPDRTFSAAIPDSDRHVFSVGLGFTSNRFQTDLAYQYSLLDDRTVSGSPDNNFDGIGDADGNWEGDGHAVIMTSTLKF
jgi:long-chain fatty acid transport protein